MTVEFWFLIGAALVFWMQAGFAMVETGFTRAKNAGNIIMKNLMDFCIGTVVFSLLGYTLMMGEDTFFGLIGKPNLDLFLHFRCGLPSTLIFSSWGGRRRNRKRKKPQARDQATFGLFSSVPKALRE